MTDKRFENDNPFCKWNDPMYQDDYDAPWNDPMHEDDYDAPWNSPLGNCDDYGSYAKKNHIRYR